MVRIGMVGMVRGHDQAAGVRTAGELDAVGGAGGIPPPVRALDRGGNLPRGRPGPAVIGTPGDEHAAGILAGAGHDFAFVIRAEVPRHQQPDLAAGLVGNRRRVAADVVPVAPNDLRLAPAPAAVGRTAQQQVYLAGVAGAALASLAEGQHRPRRGGQKHWNTIGVIAVCAGHEQIRLFQTRRRRGAPPARQAEGARAEEEDFPRCRP